MGSQTNRAQDYAGAKWAVGQQRRLWGGVFVLLRRATVTGLTVTAAWTTR